MFDDSGSKLISFAKILFIINLVLYGIAFIALLFVNFFLALLFAAIGCVAAYVSCLQIAAIGEIAQSTSLAQYTNSKIFKLLETMNMRAEQELAEKKKAQQEKEDQQKNELAQKQEEVHRDEIKRSLQELYSTSVDDTDPISFFLMDASTYTRCSGVLNAWNDCHFPHNALTDEIEKIINSAVSLERMYGPEPNRVTKLLNKIREILSKE